MTMIRVAAVAAALLTSASAFAQVPYDRLVKSDSEPANWMMYAGGYKSQRYTQLDQINKQNVTQLKPAWVYQLRVGGSVMYITPSTTTGEVSNVPPTRNW